MKLFTFFLLLFLFSTLLFSKQNIETDLYDKYIFHNEYNLAINELYKRIYCSTDDEEIAQLYVEIGLLYRKMNKNSNTLDMFNKSILFTNCDSVKDETKLVLGSTLMSMGEFTSSEYELLKLSMFSKFPNISQKATYLLGLNYVYLEEWHSAKNAFISCKDKFKTSNLIRICSEAEKLSAKSPSKAKLLSTIIPGFGQIYSKAYMDGINALLLNTATIYQLIYSIDNSQFDDLVLTDIPIFIRYYIGNINNAYVIAEKYNKTIYDDYKNEIFKDLLNNE